MTENTGQNRVEELDSGLNSSYLNRVIYYRLTRGDQAGLFGPLEFINMLRGLYSYATLNKPDPPVLVKRLNQISLTHAQKSFLLHYLDILFFDESVRSALERQLHLQTSEDDTIWMHYQAALLIEWAKLQLPVDNLKGYQDSFTSLARNYLHKGKPTDGGDELLRIFVADGVRQRLRATMQDRYSFNRVRQHLDTLPDNETKIAYLIEIKAEYLQISAASEFRSKRFDLKCDLEKDKLERLIEIARRETLVVSAQNDRATDRKAAAPQWRWSEGQYLIFAVPAAEAIGRRRNKLTDERMAEEMDCSRRTAFIYRHKYADAYNTKVRSAHEDGLKDYTARRNKN